MGLGSLSLEGPIKELRFLTGRLKHYPFLRYAADYWGHHAQGMPETTLEGKILALLQNVKALASCVQVQYQDETDSRGLYHRDHLPLHVATAFGLETTIRLLLQTPLVRLNEQDHKTRTALAWAIEVRRENIASLLVESGADIRAERSSISPLTMAIRRGYTGLVCELLAKGGHDLIGKQELECAIEIGSAAVVEKYLQSAPNPQDKQARLKEVLYRAAKYGPASILELALAEEDDLEAEDNEGCTILLKAVEYGNSGAVRLLLRNGASTLVKDPNGYDLLQLAAMSTQVFRQRLSTIGGYNPYEMTILPDDQLKMPGKAFLERFNLITRRAATLVNITADSEFVEALHEDEDHKSIISQLLQGGADLGVLSDDQESILHLAVDSAPRLELLLQESHGILDVNCRDSNERTLHIMQLQQETYP